jgi:hypothetical protein
MNEPHPKPASTTASAAIGFGLLSILMLPVSLIGYIIWIFKGVLMPNKSGVSSTAQGPLSARYTQHKLGVREDEAAVRLMPLLPGVPPLALRMATGPKRFATHSKGRSERL